VTLLEYLFSWIAGNVVAGDAHGLGGVEEPLQRELRALPPADRRRRAAGRSRPSHLGRGRASTTLHGPSGMSVPPVTAVSACGAADRRSRVRVASHQRRDMARSTRPSTSLRPHGKFVGRDVSCEWMTTRRHHSGRLERIVTVASRTIGVEMLLEPQPAHRDEMPSDVEPSGCSCGRTVAQEAANIRTRRGQLVSPSGSPGKFRRYRSARRAANPTAYRPHQPDGPRLFGFSSQPSTSRNLRRLLRIPDYHREVLP
jgi:hypothetical protein